MNSDRLESSIQNLLSVLYPPFEATAPTLLSQLFQIIDSHYHGDALRCLLDFLVPAKHILDTVQQAACALYSDVLFLCEGWPLCLHDRVVVHFAPIDPSLLRPGDFYLRVAPFCDQSARILVCSLLEEEGLLVEVVEETPIPETSYPCIFSRDWLEEFNQGRHGTPLRWCLLAAEQGVVRLPWELVAVPDFVDESTRARTSMASTSPPCPPFLPSLPQPTTPLRPLENSSSSHSAVRSATDEPCEKQYPVTIQNSILAPSSNSAFSVETRICPAKHGIAVSLCLVDTKAASSSRLVRLKEIEMEPKPVGLVSPNKWDSCCTGTSHHAAGDAHDNRCEDNGVSEIIEDKNRITKEASRSGPADHTALQGEYIDILQATMLFGSNPSLLEEQQKSEMQKRMQSGPQMQRYAPRPTQTPPCAQMEPQWQPNTGALAHSQLPAPPTPSHCRAEGNRSLRLDMSEPGPQSTTKHSQQAQPESLSSSHSVRAVCFSETPCTPCTRRRQSGKVSKAQELRCRYRDSYQAALQNPVAIEEERMKNMLAVAEEGLSQCDGNLPDSANECKGLPFNPTMPRQPHLSVTEAICEESGEKNTVSYWKPVDPYSPPCVGYVFKSDQLPEQNSQKEMDGIIDNMNGSAISAGTGLNPDTDQRALYTKHHRFPLNSGEVSRRSINLTTTGSTGLEPSFPRALPVLQSRRDSVSDGRCSSLSTAVVETSEKCELVLVEGQNIRRRENGELCSEIPQLHVVKCKNSTAFRLVSPKISRRKAAAPAGAQYGSTSVPNTNDHQTLNLSQENPPLASKTQRTCQPASASAHPRPDHLPLGSPDPRAHPLYLGVASLTGGRDKTGRAILELYGGHWGWSSAVTSQELFTMLLYFYSINRREIRQAGLTLIFDARKAIPQPQLYKALMTLQEQFVQAVNSVVLLADKESKLRPERFPGIRTEVVTSMKALFRLVDASQLSSHLEGSLTHSHCDWMELHKKLFPFVSDLHEASGLLHRAIGKLDDPQRTDSTQTVQQCMIDQKTFMKDVLEDSRLVKLQREGGAILARLRKESDLKYPHCEDFSDAVESVSSLYNHVEEQAHVLVQRTNLSLEHLEYLLQLREFQGHFMQMQQWFDVEGERHLLEAESVEDPGDRMEQVLNSFTGFLIEANDRRHHAMTLVSEAERLQQSGQSYPETEAFGALVSSFKSGLEDFLCRAEACGRELQVMVNVCDYCEQATALANECTGYLNQSQSRVCSVQDRDQITPASQIHSEPKQQQGQESSLTTVQPTTCSVLLRGNENSVLQTFQDKFNHFSPERFQEMKAEASALWSSRGMRVWNIAWLRCQEARQQLQERMHDLDDDFQQDPNPSSWHYIDVESINVQTPPPSGRSLRVQSTPGPGHPDWEDILSGEKDLVKSKTLLNSSATNLAIACSDLTVKPEDGSKGSKVPPQSPNRSTKKTEKELRRGLRVRAASHESCASDVTATGSPPAREQQVRSPSPCSRHGQPSCRILQEAQKYQVSRHGSFCSEGSCTSARGAVGGNETLCCKHSSLPIGRYEGGFCLASPPEQASNSLRLQRVLEELLLTEREYVRSLGYILTHYLPLLDRPDIPQDLRGKRGIIFGNLEKLYDFHSHYFLPELEACEREPAMVARCFLRHRESFGLYALYSKNKPQSDALILHRRHDIFKRKQQELGDLMDLSSYLLRPIQRISKYSLLLLDILTLAGSHRPKGMTQDPLLSTGVCGPSVYLPDLTSTERERERAEIQAAADLVRFQMRHGNDLLTMDAIKDCDVNLKEQGQLVRQDEFTVFYRKKKCVRRVFLFEDLILFSKTKKTDRGNDVYVYKQSFKTSDIGMTHHSSMSALCFEIWFRRRKREDTYTFRASSMEGKKAWTADLERILWDQAAHSRELRLQERVFMGMARRPFMDIHPSDAAICDRAITCAPPDRIPVACCSHRGLDYPRPHSIGSGSTASTTFSQSSSSSGRGSLPPAGYPGSQSLGVEASPALCSSPEAVGENELNPHPLHLYHLYRSRAQWNAHHHLSNNTDSSSERIDLFGSTDHRRLSAIGGELTDDESSVSSRSSKPTQLAGCQTPRFRINSSPDLNRKKPDMVPKLPRLADAECNNIIIGKSTEV
eukprot:XP_011600727.1 PREDICTED: uncharacterized protein LOC101067310 [Takifugu rubripes]